MALRRSTDKGSTKPTKPARTVEELQKALLTKKQAMYTVSYTGGIQREGLITINREYNLLRIPPLDMEVTSLILKLLSFKKRIYDHKAGSMTFETVDCYATIDIEGRTCIICGAGVASEIQELLERIGYEVLIADVVRQSPERAERAIPDKERFIRALGEPRQWQLDAFEQVLANNCGQICTATGSGKTTFIVAMIYSLPKARILFSTRKRQALAGAYDHIIKKAPDAYMAKNYKILRDKRLIICSVGMLDTIILQKLNFDWFFVDEHHETCTEHQMNKVLPIRSFKTFAFSAEYRNREDQADRWSDIAYGPLRFIRTYDENTKSNDVVPIEVRWRDCSKLPKIDLHPSDVTSIGVWNNEDRNRLIVEDALANADKQVLITVKTTEHALLLKKMLPHAGLAHGPIDEDRRCQLMDLGLLGPHDILNDEKDLNDLRALFARRKIMLVIATSVWWQAVDFPLLEVIIRADAVTSSISVNQIVGRGSRTHAIKDKEIVYDYNDLFNRTLNNRAKRRHKQYTDCGYTQTPFK